jgi:hypothetical protein
MKATSRLLVVLVLAAGLALAAPAIAATFSTGNWKGTTAQVKGPKGHRTHRKISFKADSAAQEITKLNVDAQGKCSDKGVSIDKQSGLFADVNADGTFKIEGSGPKGGTKFKLTGKISGKKASGTFVIKSRYNSKNQPDKNGSIKCSTGTVNWSAAFAG